MMTDRFTGKVALVTGGASGIGAACVAGLLREGAKVMIADRNAPPALASGNVAFIQTDVTSSAACNAAVAETVARFGKLDVLVSCAGVGKLEPSESLSDEDWRWALSINLDGLFYTARAAINQMLKQGGGTIVHLASTAGLTGHPGHVAYTSSKAGVVNMTRTLALEYGGRGIRVNAVCPGIVKTPLVAEHMVGEALAQYLAVQPLGRLAEPEEVAEPVLFLASDQASYVNGAALPIDGGYTAI